MKDLGRSMDGASIAIQGFGNVGSHAALLAHQAGAQVVAVSDASGGIACRQGLDIPQLFRDYAKPRRLLAGYQSDGVESITRSTAKGRRVRKRQSWSACEPGCSPTGRSEVCASPVVARAVVTLGRSVLGSGGARGVS
jgi:glutamate/leucine/phenylalanine/valine dehydrogenase